MSTPVTRTEEGRRPVNTSSLVLGLVFLGLAGSWLLEATGVTDADDFPWLLPLVLVLAGAAGLLASLVNGARQRSRRDPGLTSVWDEDAPL